jgi:hypothetical protein
MAGLGSIKTIRENQIRNRNELKKLGSNSQTIKQTIFQSNDQTTITRLIVFSCAVAFTLLVVAILFVFLSSAKDEAGNLTTFASDSGKVANISCILS